ncbi:hypothetical protein BLOT_004388, partial [Blomia tropicalis]
MFPLIRLTDDANGRPHPHLGRYNSNVGGRHQRQQRPQYHLTTLLLCVILLTVNAFSFLSQSSISSTYALEEEEYSVASLLPSFKTLLFWRADDSKVQVDSVDTLPVIVGSDSGQSSASSSSAVHVQYEVNDVVVAKPIDQSSSSSSSTAAAAIASSIVVHTSDVVLDHKKRVPDTIGESIVYESVKRLKVNDGPANKRGPTSRDKDNRICHSCARNDLFDLDEDEEYRQRIEYIKEQILTRLGMKRPPLLRPQPDIDLSMYMRMAERTISQRELIEFGSQRAINAVATNSVTDSVEMIEDVMKAFILPSLKDSSSPVFDLSTVNLSDETKTIKAITILVKYNLTEYYYHKLLNDDSDLFVSLQPTEENDIERNLETMSLVSASNRPNSDFLANWYQYDVTHLLNDYTGKLVRIHNDFEITSSVIMIEIVNGKNTRTKRSIDCTETVSFCCRQPFYVNFTTIG